MDHSNFLVVKMPRRSREEAKDQPGNAKVSMESDPGIRHQELRTPRQQRWS